MSTTHTITLTDDELRIISAALNCASGPAVVHEVNYLNTANGHDERPEVTLADLDRFHGRFLAQTEGWR